MTKQPVLEIFALIVSLLGIFAFIHTVFAATPVACTTITSSLSVGVSDGTKSGQVTALQTFLKGQGLLSVEPTGYFGPLTQKAVVAFQTSQKLPPVGVVGPLTRAAIKTASCVETPVAPVPVVPVHPVPVPTTPAVVTPTPVVPQAPTPAPVSVSLPYHAPAFVGWKGTWGDVLTTDSGSLLVKASTSTTGAEAMLPGSSQWADYRVTANVLTKNSEIVLIARYVDPDNMLFCTFANNWISIKQRLHGETTTVASGAVPGMSEALTPVRSTSVAMRVQGKTVGCSELGPDDNITWNNVDSSLLKGGIGFDTWNQNTNFASTEVFSLDAKAL